MPCFFSPCEDAGPIVQCADPEGAARDSFQRVGWKLRLEADQFMVS